jgi:class 3 adenylate cyclase
LILSLKKFFWLVGVYFLPVLPASLICGIFVYGARLYESLAVAEHERVLQHNSQSALSMVAGNYAYDSQVSRMGRKWADLLAAHASESRKSDGFAIDPRVTVEFFNKVFPISHRPAGTKIWAFGGTEDNPVLLAGDGLEKAYRAVSTQLYSVFVSLARFGRLSGGLDRHAGNMYQSFLGKDLNHQIVGATLEGFVVPVVHEGEKAYLYWKRVRDPSGYFGGLMVIFPESLPLTSRPLDTVLNDVYRFFGRTVVPVMIPVKCVSGALRPRFPDVFRKNSLQGRFFIDLATDLLDQEDLYDRGGLFSYRGYMVFRDYFSTNEPYELFLIYPEKEIAGYRHWRGSGFVLKLTLMIFLVFFAAVVLGKGPHLSLKSYLTLVFLLLASLPISSFFVLGSYQIDLAFVQKLDQIRDTALERIYEIDRQAEAISGRFSRVVNTTLGDSSVKNRLLEPTEESDESIFKLLSERLVANNLTLETMNLIRPGRFPRLFFRDGEKALLYHERSLIGVDIIHSVNEIVRKLSGGRSIELTNRQKSFQTTSLFQGRAAQSVFVNLNDIGNQTELARGEKHVYHCFTANRGGHPAVYVLLQTSSAELQLNHLLLQAAEMMEDEGFVVSVASFEWGGHNLLFPTLNEDFWLAESGKTLKSTIQRTANTEATWQLLRGENLYLGTVLKHCEGFVMGVVVPIDHILRGATRQRVFLVVFCLVMILFSFFILGRMNSFLVEPIVNSTLLLKGISTGEYSKRLDEARDDEFGVMARAFNKMLEGLKERRMIGRLVSGAFDRALSESDGEISDSGKEIMGAVLASDIRSFTTLSESIPADMIVLMLNEHLSAMSAIIRKHGGTIDKFIGDAIVCLFSGSAPAESVESAISAACEMMSRHNELQKDRQLRGDFTYSIGIGIDFGPMITGAIDGAGRFEYVIVGSPRDNSEVLEGVSKLGKHTRIIVSESVLKRSPEACRFDEIPGKSAWELIEAR